MDAVVIRIETRIDDVTNNTLNKWVSTTVGEIVWAVDMAISSVIARIRIYEFIMYRLVVQG